MVRSRDHNELDDDPPAVVITDLGAPRGPVGTDTTPQRRSPKTPRSRSVVFPAALSSAFVLLLGGSGLVTEARLVDPASTVGCNVIAAEMSEHPKNSDSFHLATHRLVSAIDGSEVTSFSIEPGITTIYGSNLTAEDHPAPLARVHSTGLWEFCSTSAELTLLEDRPYPDETELGRLPEGMAYVYQLDDGQRGYMVTGVRVRDGSIVDTVTNLDGQAIPQSRTSAR